MERRNIFIILGHFDFVSRRTCQPSAKRSHQVPVKSEKITYVTFHWCLEAFRLKETDIVCEMKNVTAFWRDVPVQFRRWLPCCECTACCRWKRGSSRKKEKLEATALNCLDRRERKEEAYLLQHFIHKPAWFTRFAGCSVYLRLLLSSVCAENKGWGVQPKEEIRLLGVLLCLATDFLIYGTSLGRFLSKMWRQLIRNGEYVNQLAWNKPYVCFRQL